MNNDWLRIAAPQKFLWESLTHSPLFQNANNFPQPLILIPEVQKYGIKNQLS